MKQIILGTAGHIDHGKTSLIKAVTGVDTDRLKEEKLRGITIELGFASLELPNGRRLGIVDVPGHEKFVKNMVAGATGIDIVAMVIAADEGVMPQTREHMEICTLLGVGSGLVVLTKTDMVDEEWLELVKEDVGEFVRGTFLEDKPVIPVSSATGEGIPDFVNALESLCEKEPERSATGLLRLPVDRVFTMKGFGTVITGTLVSGRIGVGESIMIYPSKIASKVRGIQVHNLGVDQAEAGMRTAVNFQGLEKAAVNRGDVLSNPGGLVPSYMLDVSFNYLPSNKKSLKSRKLVRFHSGTSEILGNLVLLDREELEPGESVVAQIRLEYPVSLVKDDRFVIRSYSPVYTIGGGEIINPIPKKHKRFRPEIYDGLHSLTEKEPEDIVAWHVRESVFAGVTFSDLKIMSNLPEKRLDTVIQSLLSKQTAMLVDKEARIYIHRDTFDKLTKQCENFLGEYHSANPLKAGMSKGELNSKLPSSLGAKMFNLMIDRMIKDGRIVLSEDIVHLKSHKVSLGTDQADVRKKILGVYATDGLTPPYFKDLCKTLDIGSEQAKDVLMLLVEEGKIVKAKEDLFFHAAAVEKLKEKTVGFLKANGEMTTPQFKEIAGVSRKYLIPLIEHFDSKNVTLRVGDIRKLRGG